MVEDVVDSSSRAARREVGCMGRSRGCFGQLSAGWRGRQVCLPTTTNVGKALDRSFVKSLIHGAPRAYRLHNI